MFAVNADLKSAYTIPMASFYLFGVHRCNFTVFLLYSGTVTQCQLAVRGGSLLSYTLLELMLVITSSMAVPAGPS